MLYLTGAVLFLTGGILGCFLGSTHISLGDMAAAVFDGDRTTLIGRIFWYVRFPRTCGALLCGAALAVSGAVIQCVLANRLASPSIIGVNSGAGLAVVLCSAFGITGGWRFSLAAFVGSFCAVMIVTVGARKWGASRGTVILMGVALNAFFGAVSDTLVTFIPDISVMSNDFRIGDFASVTDTKLIPAAVLIPLCIFILLTFSNDLDVLTLGEETAKGLGLNTNGMRVFFLLLSAVLAGTAVSICGLLSFVGLLVPHAVRRLSGGRGHLIPLCALFGGGFVAVCDTLARTVFTPYELPVGIIMAFLGGPFFLFVLVKGKGGHGCD